MTLIPNHFHHYYNQGNNRGQIFFSRENKLYFLRKFREHVLPYCEVVAYCLMDNHFHFLISTNELSVQEKQLENIKISALNNGFRKLMSGYAQAINKQNGRTGLLFRPKSKHKLLDSKKDEYPFICFQYIHQNPWVAGLVSKMEDWEFSSFLDYNGKRNGTICNQELAYKYLDVSIERFYKESYEVISPDKIRNLFL